jgi:hypothetical protein
MRIELTMHEKAEMLDHVMRLGKETIWYEKYEWVGKAADGTIVNLGSGPGVIAYLRKCPSPSDW